MWASVVGFVSLAVLVACTSSGDVGDAGDAGDANERVRVVASFTILADMARGIGGDRVDVHTLVPTGTDPHEYEPLPDDIKATHDADLLLMNGLNLEGGDDGWFTRLVSATGQDPQRIIEASADIEPLFLGDDGRSGTQPEVNPHSFVDPVNGILMAEQVRDGLITVDPDHADTYEERGARYLAELQAL